MSRQLLRHLHAARLGESSELQSVQQQFLLVALGLEIGNTSFEQLSAGNHVSLIEDSTKTVLADEKVSLLLLFALRMQVVRHVCTYLGKRDPLGASDDFQKLMGRRRS